MLSLQLLIFIGSIKLPVPSLAIEPPVALLLLVLRCSSHRRDEVLTGVLSSFAAAGGGGGEDSPFLAPPGTSESDPWNRGTIFKCPRRGGGILGRTRTVSS